MCINYDDVYRKIYLWIGITCTGSALSVGLGSVKMGVFNWLLIFSLLIRIVQIYTNKERLYTPCRLKSIYIFCLCLLVSTFMSMIYLPKAWIINSFSLSFKLIIYLGGIISLFSNEQLLVIKKYFFRGLYYGTLCQLCWGGMQAICWYGFRVNLNKTIFGDVLQIGVSSGISWDGNILGDTIMRFTGLSWEPANFALVMLVGIILSKKIIVKILFALMIIFSYSKTGFLALMILVVCLVIEKLKECICNKRLFLTYIFFYKVFFLFLILALLIVVELDKFTYLFSVINEGLDNLYIAIMTEESMSGNIHKMYYLALLDVLSESNFEQILFGYGTFSAGYPYAMLNIIPYGVDGAWNPETDFVTLLVGNGLIGAICYYYMIVSNIFCSKRKESMLLMIVILTCGITYLYVRGTWSLLIILFTAVEVLEHNEKKNVIPNKC